MVLFTIQYRMVWTFDSLDEILKCDHTNESYQALFLCAADYYAYKVVLTVESVDEILKCGHSNESYWAAPPRGAVYYAVQGGSNFWICGRTSHMWPFKWNLQRTPSMSYRSQQWTRWCKQLDETLKCEYLVLLFLVMFQVSRGMEFMEQNTPLTFLKSTVKGPK